MLSFNANVDEDVWWETNVKYQHPFDQIRSKSVEIEAAAAELDGCCMWGGGAGHL